MTGIKTIENVKEYLENEGFNHVNSRVNTRTDEIDLRYIKGDIYVTITGKW